MLVGIGFVDEAHGRRVNVGHGLAQHGGHHVGDLLTGEDLPAAEIDGLIMKRLRRPRLLSVDSNKSRQLTPGAKIALLGGRAHPS